MFSSQRSSYIASAPFFPSSTSSLSSAPSASSSSLTGDIFLAVFSFCVFVYVCIFWSAALQAGVVLVACVGFFSLGSLSDDGLVLGHVAVLEILAVVATIHVDLAVRVFVATIREFLLEELQLPIVTFSATDSLCGFFVKAGCGYMLCLRALAKDGAAFVDTAKGFVCMLDISVAATTSKDDVGADTDVQGKLCKCDKIEGKLVRFGIQIAVDHSFSGEIHHLVMEEDKYCFAVLIR